MKIINILSNPLPRNLIPMGSRLELALRTLYHRLNATRPFVNARVRKAKSSYSVWKTSRPKLPVVSATPADGAVTFLLAVEAGKENDALETLRSLASLTQRGWRVIPVLAAGVKWDSVNDTLPDSRIFPPVREITGLRPMIEQLRTDYIVFCSAGDRFDPTLLDHFYLALGSHPAGDLYYFDCEYFNPVSGDSQPFFKPSSPSPELMLSLNYLTRAFIRSSHLAELDDRSIDKMNLQAVEYGICLDLLHRQALMHHIPAILARFDELTPDMNSAFDKVISRHLEKIINTPVTVSWSRGSRRVNWLTSEPSVSLVILNKDHGRLLRGLLESIAVITTYTNYSIVIVDNQSSEPEALRLLTELEHRPGTRVIHYDEPFNYSTAVNLGVANADGEVVVTLNNDMLVVEPGWLRELVQWAIRPEIGVVGGKLLHKNRSIQHTGIILGMNGFIGHLYLNAPEDYLGLAGSANWYRNFNALTGACQAFRREVFLKVGGYDPRFRLAFGDIDFCLRVTEAGFRNLYVPFAQLIHFEGSSRGYETPTPDIQLGYEVLKPWLEVDDGYFSPNLTYDTIPACEMNPGTLNTRVARIEERRRSVNARLSPSK